MGAGCLAIAGIASWIDITFLSILVFIIFYLIQNVRRPINVANISDQISNKVMASGLSVESQVTTILTAILAPILGTIADAYNVGTALFTFGLLMAGLSIFVTVRNTERIKET